ncbi:thiol peroxidase [Campylobacter hyointestinalis]|uniref:thiol peroxidase n=1 Tax=Campylobacter hyointestinalis TaxID=198 RepID=UPI0004D87A94|nr:thiol peroxidase [Campylobacter hyointestinalis]ANE33350.1 lipid hydroperoxide peroxidase [Campylobacter hyointestinalis subsp. hyointestinalis LMG 9260]KEA44598.1 thiol peroxidase [Campylobacter hyointestinalis subsp. hyointestinalis]MDL2346193.1 thiol peroxidase [Campylobacter hyointestinalis]MDL2347933.1 thiol peroxidase [Campylobacter hyointestinalis]MDL2349676.1 thiol peroxidase [Campylobacter hyointestinalis]
MSNVTFKGTPVSLEGDTVNVGQKAPVVEVVGKDLSSFEVGGANGKFQVLIAVPSLDTGVCATETRKFNEKLAGKNGVSVNVISMDLPFAMGRFCATEGIENLKVGSDFRGAKFAKAYGLLLKDSPLAGLLARAVFVLDKDGVVIYKEIVSEITTEPNYEAIIAALSSSCGCGCGHH